MATVVRNIASEKSCEATSDISPASTSGVKRKTCTASEKYTSEWLHKYIGNSKHDSVSEDCQINNPQKQFMDKDYFKLPDEPEDLFQETTIEGTRTDQQVPSLHKSQFNSADDCTLAEQNQKVKISGPMSSTGTNLLFNNKSKPSETMAEEKFTTEFKRILYEEKENCLLSERFKPSDEVSPQVEKSLKIRNNIETVSKGANETPIFKVPKTCSGRVKKTTRTKSVSRSKKKPKTKKNFEDSKCKAADELELQQSQFQNVSLQSRTSIDTVLSDELSLNAMLSHRFNEIVNEVTSLARSTKDSNLEFSTRLQELASFATDRISKSADYTDTLLESPRNNLNLEFSPKLQELTNLSFAPDQISKSEDHAEMVSRLRIGTRQLSDTRNDSEDVSRCESGDVSRVGFLVNQYEINYMYDLAADARSIERLISRRLESLEDQIYYFNCERQAIPPWSQRLETILHHLTKPRSSRVRRYLAEQNHLEKRRPLFEIREIFIQIIDTIGYGMNEILDVVKYIISEGTLKVDHIVIDKAAIFWNMVENDYTDFISHFHEIQDDYPNFREILADINHQYSNIKEIFIAFHDSIIDLFDNI